MATKKNTVPKSSMTSAVTTDLPDEAVDQKALKAEQDAAFKELDPAIAAGLGLVKVDGVGFEYVGIAPAREKDAETPSGLPIRADNSTFTPLANVPFSPSIRVKDPKSGEYYFPGDGVTSWDGCELNGSYLIPRKK